MRILIVENEPDMRRDLSKCLYEKGCEVETEDDGKMGLFRAMNQEFDALVIDAMLPTIDGWKLLSSLRDFKSTPALMLIPDGSVDDRARSLKIGSEDFLIKPLRLPEFLIRLCALIRGSTGQKQRILQIGDVQIDSLRRLVTRGSEQVSLTEIEYSLIELLVSNRGELVTRPMIYQRLYESDDDSLSSRVDAHVSSIRKKLGYEFIVTRKGRGYLIVE